MPGYSGPLGCQADDDGGRDDGSTHGDPIHVPTGDVLLESEGYDAIGLSPLSTIRLARYYSSKRAIRDTMAHLGESSVSPIRSAALGLPQTGFSPGWYHRFDYWLVTDVTPSGVTAPETLLFFPNRTNDRFATSGPGLYGDTFYYVDTDGSHHVVLANDTDLKFEAATPGSSTHRLAQMRFTDGRFRTFRYYGSGGASPCASTASHEVGKLCQIEDSDGAWIHFAGYSSVHGYVTSIESQGTPSAPRHRVTYEYSTSDVEGANEDGTTFVHAGLDSVALTQVRFFADDGSGFVETNGRSYEYTRIAYYRPDLASETDAYQDADRLIVTHENHSIDFLRRVRSYDGTFVVGFEYDVQRRGAASISPGEFMRFEYVGTAADEDNRRVRLVNESTGAINEIEIADNGTVVNISDECACSRLPSELERASDGTLLAEVSLPPGELVDEPTRGIRTTYLRDARGHVILTKENASADEDASSLPADPTVIPMQVTRRVYDPSGESRVFEEGPVFSAICLDGTASHPNLSCPADALDFEPRVVFDYDTGADAYDVEANESPGPYVTQVIEYGITVDDVSAGSLSWQARVVATRYLADGRIESQTSASGIETVYTYYPSGPGNDSERLWKVTEDGVWLREFGGYDASGRATRSRDVESDVLTTTVFDPDGRVLSTVVTDGSVARSTFYDYDSAGRQIRTRSTATGLGYELINETEIFAGLPGITDPRSPDFCETQNGASDVAAAQAECIEALGYLDADVATLSGVGVGALDHLDSRADMQLNPDGTIAGSSTLNASNAIERRTESVFDENGQQIRSLKYTDDPLSPSYVRESYLNGLGWIIRETDPRFADVAANHAANESRANTETRYDRLGRAKSVTVALGTPDEATTTYSYDAHGNIASVTDANGNQTRYVYDDFDSLVLVESPDTGVTRYRYDAESRLVEKLTADGARSTYTYDNRGRTLSELFDVDDGPHAVDRYFFYDTFGGSPATLGATCASTGEVFDPSNTQGRLAWVQHGAGVTYYSYDPFGATTAVFEQVESTFDVCTLRIVRYGYDSLGRKILMTYPSGREIRWIYGANSAHPVRLELVEPGETPVVLMDQLAFDSAGSFIGYAAGSVSFGAEFDLSGQFVVRDYATTSGQDFLWTIDVDGSGMVEADERDGDGNPLQVGDAARAKTLDLSYDGQSRLTSSAGENLRGYQDCEWVYDGVGNRVGETCYGKQVSYEIAPDGNALLSTTYATNALACNDPNETVTQARTRDVLGRQTNGFNGRFGDAIEDFVLEYGADTRLSRATVAGATYDYVYDHRMLRWRTTAGGTASGVRDTVYGTSGSLLSETKYSGETHEYVWLGSTPVALIVDTDGSGTSPAAAMILGVDHLGTPHRAWDSSTGAPTWAGDYEA
ncbi:MAG: hypothetical protein AAGJ56_09605, partial [Myxococcota bacterium]